MDESIDQEPPLSSGAPTVRNAPAPPVREPTAASPVQERVGTESGGDRGAAAPEPDASPVGHGSAGSEHRDPVDGATEPELEPATELGPEPEPDPAGDRPSERVVAVPDAPVRPETDPLGGQVAPDPLVRAGEEPTAAPSEPDPALARIERGVADLAAGLEGIARLSQRANDHASALHAENTRLRSGELATATLPLTRDLIRLTDELDLLLTACDPAARSDLELVRSRVLEVLARWGVETFATAVGDPFDAKLHQGAGRIETSEHLDGSVASIRKPGFRQDDGHLLRPAEVEIYTYVQPEPAQALEAERAPDPQAVPASLPEGAPSAPPSAGDAPPALLPEPDDASATPPHP